MRESKLLALLAGRGELPLEFLKNAASKGREVITFALKGITSPEVEKLSARTVWIEPFKLGKFLKELQKSTAKEIAFLGKLEHRNALSIKGLDLKAITFLVGLQDRKPETVIRGIFKEVEKLGVKVIDPTPYLSHLILPSGTFLGPPPPKEVAEEMRKGLETAKAIASLDVGQTVVIKEGTVVAVEAVEGTDACIERGASLGGKGFLVCKAARKEQDMKVDVPTVGIETVKLVASLGGAGIAVEGEKTFILNKEEVEKLCRERGLYFAVL